MKWGVLIFSAVFFGCIYVLSSTGLAVHRTQSISVAVGFVKAGTIPESELPKVERELRSVGNADFYYRTISEVAAIGCAANAFFIGYCFWIAKRKSHPGASVGAKRG